MKLNSIWKEVPLKNYVYLALGANVLTLLFILLIKNFLPPEVPLFYGNAVGESQLVETFLLIIAPAVAILILCLNVFLSTVVGEPFLKKVLIISSFFVSMLTSITVFKIIFLVGFF